MGPRPPTRTSRKGRRSVILTYYCFNGAVAERCRGGDSPKSGGVRPRLVRPRQRSGATRWCAGARDGYSVACVIGPRRRKGFVPFDATAVTRTPRFRAVAPLALLRFAHGFSSSDLPGASGGKARAVRILVELAHGEKVGGKSSDRDDLQGDVKMLTPSTPEYRLWVGGYRVLFEVSGSEVQIYRIRHRRDAYS
jgi:mRNA interferase RelE/StbE